MEKDLKSYIQDNRAAFDTANPPDVLWDRIAKSLDEQNTSAPKIRKLGFSRFARVAAALLLLGIAGALIFTYGRKQGYEDYNRINPQLAAEQRTYADMVLQKKDSIAFIAAADPTLYGEFSAVLEQMDTNYQSLKQELPTSPNQEMTLEAMIQNLKIQIEVLGQQIDTYHYINETNKKHANEHQI